MSKRVAVIQEDRNAENRGPEVAGGYARVLVYDFRTRQLRVAARVDEPNSSEGEDGQLLALRIPDST